MKTISMIKHLGFFSAAAALMYFGDAGMAHAAGTGFQTVLKDQVGATIGAVPKLVTFTSYILGLGITAKGILAGKKYSENPGDVKNGLLGVIGPLAVGGMLIALPTVATMVIDTTTTGTGSKSQFGQNGAVSDSY